MSQLTIKEIQSVVAGKFVSQFVVVDAAGNLLGKKAHKTEAEANVELGSLKFYAQGLEFAKATAPAGTAEKALVGKANTIAAYLLWVEEGSKPAAEGEAAEGETTTESPEFGDSEQF